MWFDLAMRDRQRSFDSIERSSNNVSNIISIKERNQRSNRDRSDGRNPGQYSSNFQPNFQRQFQSYGFQNSRSSYQSYSNNSAYQSNQPAQQAQALSASRQSLLLTEENNSRTPLTSGSDSNSPRYSNNRRSFQRPQKTYSVTMIEENIEQESLDEAYDRFARSYHDGPSTELKEAYYQDVSDDYAEGTLEEKTDRNDDVMNAEFVTSIRGKFKTICRQCKAEFAFNSRLHEHLRQTKFQCKTASSNLQISAAVSSELSESIVPVKIFTISFEILSKDRILIQFTAESVEETDYAFREWKYATFKAS